LPFDRVGGGRVQGGDFLDSGKPIGQVEERSIAVRLGQEAKHLALHPPMQEHTEEYPLLHDNRKLPFPL
jgi:hypothetical protein